MNIRQKIITVISILLCFLLFCSCSILSIPFFTGSSSPEATPQNNDPPAPDMGDFKAMWLSQYDLVNVYIDKATKTQVNQELFTENISIILNNIKNLGFNTIMLQIRPNADSMYPSEYYPMSEYVVGKYGEKASYDPVEIIVSQAHNIELDIHAWINPLRAMSTKNIELIDNQYKIKQWYNDQSLNGTYIVKYNGLYYLNPAHEEVRNLIIDGAREALTKYDFDGLHMDDYFYPTTDETFDKETYSQYKIQGGKLNLMNFRREALNKLVSGLFTVAKGTDENLLFGISPAGIITNVYNSNCADVYKWCSTYGYIDYICPQVYFGLEHETYDFVSVCNTYKNIIKTRSVNLIIGMTFGKAYSKVDDRAGTGKYEWQQNSDILARCLSFTENLEKCTGIAVFCYQYFYDCVSHSPILETADEVENFIPVLEKISWQKDILE